MRHAAALLLALAAVALFCTPAQAAWPGQDGRIYFYGAETFWSILPNGSGLREETEDDLVAVAADGARLVSADFQTFRWRPVDVPVFTDVLPRAGAGRLTGTVPTFLRDGDVIAALAYPTRSDPADAQSRFGIGAISRTAGVPPRDILRFATGNAARPEVVRGTVIGSAARDEAFYGRPPNTVDLPLTTCGEAIEAVDTVTGATHTVTPLQPPFAAAGPTPACNEDTLGDVSPDGERVVFTRSPNFGSGIAPDLRTAPRAGGGSTVIATGVHNGAFFEGALYAPSGEHVVAVRIAGGVNQLVRVPAGGGAPVTLVSNAGDDRFDAIGLVAWQGTSVAGPRFTGGPSGLTRETSATIPFEAPSGAGAGSFQCRLDSAPFASCTSPVVLTGLTDGEHRFELTFTPTGGSPGPVEALTWTVDTTAPATTLVSGPSGLANGPNADIAWDSAAADVERFECQLDGGPAFACSSPHPLRGLAGGLHRFAIVAVDRAGNFGVPVELTWEVERAVPPVTLQCATPTATAGVLVGVAREEAACWVEEQIDGRKALTSTGVVSVNGIQVSPGPGTKVVIAPELAGGSFRTTGPVTLALGAIQWPVTRPLAWTGLTGATVAQVPKMFELLQQEVAGLRLTAVPSLELTADNGGQAKLGLKLTLPKAFKAAPGAPPGGAANATALTIEPSVTTSNDRGVTFAGKITVAEAWLFGRAKVKDLSLAGDSATNTFEGSLGLELATSGRLSSQAISKDALITFGVSLGPADITRAAATPLGALRKLSAQVSRFEKHLGEGFYLQRFGAELAAGTDASGKPAVVVSGNVGLSFGPRLQYDGLFEGELLSIDGKGTLTIPTSDTSTAPITYEVTGDGKLVDLPVTNITLKIDTTPKVTFSARQQFDFGGFGASYGISDAFFDPRTLTYGARGSAQLRLPLIGSIDGEVVQSSNGFAACAQVGRGPRFGFGKRWTDPASDFQVFASACDIGPFSASASQAGPRSVEVKRGQQVLVLEVAGTGAAPRITLTGPRGESLTSPLRRGGTLLLEDGARTFALVPDPSPGRWTVTGDGIRAVRQARELPPVSVRATVRRGRLNWRVRPISGQRVTFRERGKNTASTILTTGARSGSVRLRPAMSPDRRRWIEAVVVQNGVPRATRIVARFTARPAERAGRVSKLRRSGRRTVAWRGSGASWVVVARYSDGSVVTRTVKRRSARFPRGGTATVSVVGLGADGRAGRATAARVKL